MHALLTCLRTSVDLMLRAKNVSLRRTLRWRFTLSCHQTCRIRLLLFFQRFTKGTWLPRRLDFDLDLNFQSPQH